MGVDIDVSESCQHNMFLLPHQPLPLTNAVWLFCERSHNDLVVITSNDDSEMWYWKYRQSSISGVPMLEQLSDGNLMSNELNNDAKSTQHNTISSPALSRNGFYLAYISGEVVSLLYSINFKVRNTFMEPPPAATYLAFDPPDSNIIAIGMDDSKIQIYDWRKGKCPTVCVENQWMGEEEITSNTGGS